jgi:HEAT repeat protein
VRVIANVSLQYAHRMESPAQAIERLKNNLRSRSDADLLRELETLPALPPEDGDAWEVDSQWWQTAQRFIALADLAAERRLRAAVPLLLERACYGDPGEMMRGLRHSLEAIVAPDYDDLAFFCVNAAASPQPGARLWAVEELGVLRDRRALAALLTALNDPAKYVRQAACRSLSMLTQKHADLRTDVLAALTDYRHRTVDAMDQRNADSAIRRIAG